MRSETSTDTATPLRLAGFLTLAAGAVLAGVGATRVWATVGFPQDEAGAADVWFHGTDVWDGKVVLLLAFVALGCLLALRVAGRRSTKRTLAIALIVLGVIVAAVSLADAIRARDRFGGGEGLDKIASGLADRLDLPEDVVRGQLEEQFAAALRVDVGVGLWLSFAGGLLIVCGGALSLVWASRAGGPPPGDGPSRHEEFGAEAG